MKALGNPEVDQLLFSSANTSYCIHALQIACFWNYRFLLQCLFAELIKIATTI